MQNLTITQKASLVMAIAFASLRQPSGIQKSDWRRLSVLVVPPSLDFFSGISLPEKTK
jgi:hypothetical protein